MQSSYRVIKNNSVLKQGEKEIATMHIPVKSYDNDCFNSNQDYSNFENLTQAMIENARKKSEDLISQAYKEVARIEQEAFDKGSKSGYEMGYKKGYSDVHDKAVKDSEDIIQRAKNEYAESLKRIEEARLKAENILKDARKEYEKYLDDKTEEIKNIILLITERFLKKEVENEEALNNIISELIKEAKSTSMFIIKCNPLYSEELRKTAGSISKQLMRKEDITVLEDDSFDKGKVIIEKENGEIIVSIEEALSKIDELLNEK